MKDNLLDFKDNLQEFTSDQEGLLHAITKSVKDPIIMLNGKGDITFWNEAATETLGYSSAEVMGKNLHQLIVPPRFIPDHEKAFRLFQREGNGAAIGKTLEMFAVHKNGEEFPVELSLSAFWFHNEWCSIGIIHDITLRKKAEAELLKLSRAVDQSPVSIVVTDLDGNIEYANPKAFDTTGYTFEELKGKNPRVLKSGETPDFEYKVLWETITSGKQWQGTFHNKRKNGDLYWESSTISPIIDANGEITSYIAVKEDITTQKIVQDKLVESEAKLRLANVTKDKLFSIIGHDLRGPIGNFMPILEILTDDDYNLGNEEKNRLILELKKASVNTLGLLENLLNWAKSQSEKFSLTPDRILINDIIHRNSELFTSVAKQKSISISLSLQKDFYVMADQDSIDLVVRNLLSNAIKYTNLEGTISISAKDTGHFIEVEIQDNWVGMPKELADKLFTSKAFHSTPGTNREKGSGLGLVLCKDFVEKNGGKIRVETIPDEGSRFVFTIPKSD